MGKRTEFRLSGSGGQGIISCGIILADAAVEDGKEALQSQSYGPEARGGASKAEVVISDETIDYPKATTPNYLLCLTDEAFRLYALTSDESTEVIADASVNTEGFPRPVTKAPILAAAAENKVYGNIVALGFIAGHTKVVSRQAVEDALARNFPKKEAQISNAKALAIGYDYAEGRR